MKFKLKDLNKLKAIISTNNTKNTSSNLKPSNLSNNKKKNASSDSNNLFYEYLDQSNDGNISTQNIDKLKQIENIPQNNISSTDNNKDLERYKDQSDKLIDFDLLNHYDQFEDLLKEEEDSY
tara:strand:- start:2921 stop:3286 length:366 start_codon:yes stop_codon:yes gene_type:complete